MATTTLEEGVPPLEAELRADLMAMKKSGVVKRALEW
eukprot:COSAG05_NODE_52_length_23775_cov_49.471110_10_plen_37_part_00